jgi:hypothetical protein
MSMASPQWGGRRTPRNPAPVSGPGQLSRRTDGGPQQTTQDMTGMAYGENADFNAIQGAAPLSASQQPSAGRTRPSRSGGQGVPGVPLFSPTGFPEEPVTAGAPIGPGDGPPDQGMFQQSINRDFEMLRRYLPDLETASNFSDAPSSFRYLVSYLRNYQ